MYLKSFRIENIRSVEKLSWDIDIGRAAGWHVIIGDNGSGKTSVLRSLALAMVGPSEAMALRQDWSSWLREGSTSGKISLTLDCDKAFDKFLKGRPVENYFLTAGLVIERSSPGKNAPVELRGTRPKFDPKRHVWGERRAGLARPTDHSDASRAAIKTMRGCFTRTPSSPATSPSSGRASRSQSA